MCGVRSTVRSFRHIEMDLLFLDELTVLLIVDVPTHFHDARSAPTKKAGAVLDTFRYARPSSYWVVLDTRDITVDMVEEFCVDARNEDLVWLGIIPYYEGRGAHASAIEEPQGPIRAAHRKGGIIGNWSSCYES